MSLINFSVLRRLARDESAATLVEYGLLLALVGLILLGSLRFLGGSLTEILDAIHAGLSRED